VAVAQVVEMVLVLVLFILAVQAADLGKLEQMVLVPRAIFQTMVAVEAVVEFCPELVVLEGLFQIDPKVVAQVVVVR
jgi:hypothetical protein